MEFSEVKTVNHRSSAIRLGSGISAWVVATGVVALSFPAHAEPPDPQALVRAQKIYDDAMAEVDAKNFAAACPKLEEVVQLVPRGIGGRLALAGCYEGLGQIERAWRLYGGARLLAVAANEKDTENEAAAKIAELQAKLALLKLVVPRGVRDTPGLSITLDGVALDPANWGAEIAVAPGKHTLEASAPGRSPWKPRIQVLNGFTKELEVPVLPELYPSPTTSPISPLIENKPHPGLPVTPTTAERVSTPSFWSRPGVPLVFALGGASFALSGVFLGLAVSANSASEDRTNYSGQTTECVTERATHWRTVALYHSVGATAAFVTGLAVIAIGFPLALRLPPAEKKGAGKTAHSFHVDIDGRGLRLVGSF